MLDLSKGYWQVPVQQTERAKNAFAYHLMASVLGEMNLQILLKYLNDIIIYSRSFVEEHLLHLQLVFKRLRAAGLK